MLPPPAQGATTDKLTASVTFPLKHLRLHQFASPECGARPAECAYELFAVSNHYGTLSGALGLGCEAARGRRMSWRVCAATRACSVAMLCDEPFVAPRPTLRSPAPPCHRRPLHSHVPRAAGGRRRGVVQLQRRAGHARAPRPGARAIVEGLGDWRRRRCESRRASTLHARHVTPWLLVEWFPLHIQLQVVSQYAYILFYVRSRGASAAAAAAAASAASRGHHHRRSSSAASAGGASV